MKWLARVTMSRPIKFDGRGRPCATPGILALAAGFFAGVSGILLGFTVIALLCTKIGRSHPAAVVGLLCLGGLLSAAAYLFLRQGVVLTDVGVTVRGFWRSRSYSYEELKKSLLEHPAEYVQNKLKVSGGKHPFFIRCAYFNGGVGLAAVLFLRLEQSPPKEFLRSSVTMYGGTIGKIPVRQILRRITPELSLFIRPDIRPMDDL